ncbi:MAG: lysophospholipase [Bacteroidota bacterium]
MAHHSFTFQHASQEFFAQSWLPEHPKALIVLVHGHGEHSGRYAHVADFFNQQGYALIGMDLHGHGQTAGKRGHAPSYDAMLDSVAQLVQEAAQKVPGVPVFMYGHSMGGNIALNYVMRREHQLAGLILSSPWLRLAFTPSSVDVFLAKMMINLYPSFTQSTKLDASAISQIPEEVKKYQDDPLIHDMVSPVMYLGTHQAGLWALEHANSLKTPTLIVHGTGDRLTSWEASQEFSKQAPQNLMTFKTWEGLFHEMHYEAKRDEVFSTYAEWLNRHLVPAS